MRKTRLTKYAVGLSLGLLLMALLAFDGSGRALASCTPNGTGTECASANVGAGTLSTTTSNPSTIAVNVGGATSTTALPITANDDRGEAIPSGWNVALTMSAFSDGTHTLTSAGGSANATVSLTGLTTSCGTGGCTDGNFTGTNCPVATTFPETITTDGSTSASFCDTGFQPAGASDGTPANADQGAIVLNPTLSLAVNYSAAISSTYASTVTVTIATDVA